MGSTTMTTTEKIQYVGLGMRVRTTSAVSPIAVRSLAHAGTPGAITGELRLVPGMTAATDDVFRVPGTDVPGGPPA